MADILQGRVWQLLRTIDDPEMPVSIVDLGIIVSVEVDGGNVRIAMTPTYSGCPALGMIEQQIRQQVLELDGVRTVDVAQVFDPPWHPGRITSEGRARLQAHGVTVGSAPSRDTLDKSGDREPVACPYCLSIDTRVDSAFGPTRCRAIYYCHKCRNSFEHIKTA